MTATEPQPEHRWTSGNARADGNTHRGWWFGPNVINTPPETSGPELKWNDHPAGDRPEQWVPARTTSDHPAWTISGLLAGRFRILLPGAVFILGSPGDYVVIPPDMAHTWHAMTDSTVLTVRWPATSHWRQVTGYTAPRVGQVTDGTTEPATRGVIFNSTADQLSAYAETLRGLAEHPDDQRAVHERLGPVVEHLAGVQERLSLIWLLAGRELSED